MAAEPRVIVHDAEQHGLLPLAARQDDAAPGYVEVEVPERMDVRHLERPPLARHEAFFELVAPGSFALAQAVMLHVTSAPGAGLVNAFAFKIVEKLLISTEELRRVTRGLEDAAVGIAQAPMPGALRNNAKLARDSATAITASAAALLATAERVEKLAAIEHSFDTARRVRRNDTADPFRESAANVLAAAFVKTKGGNIAQSSDWEPALRAAGTAVDALADYVVARLMSELGSKCSQSGIFAVAAVRDEGNG